MASHFLPRIASRIRFLVSAVIQRDVADPRLGLVTVLKVVPTTDLREAQVHVSIFGKPGDRSKTLSALEDARGFIQKEVARNLETRVAPRLTFVLDESVDKVSRIEALVEQDRDKQEDPMAKKPSKKDEGVSKGGSAKPRKPGGKSVKPTKGSGGPPAKPARELTKAPKGPAQQHGEGGGEIKAGRPDKPERVRKSYSREDFEGERAPEKEFAVDGIDDEEKDFADEFEPLEPKDEDADEDEEDEEEDEEEAEEEDEEY